MTVRDDIRLMKFDFISEMGSLICSFGAAVSAAAANENVELIEMALRQCSAAVMEAITEYRALVAETDGGAND